MLQNTVQMKDVSSKMQQITYLSFKMQRIAVKTTKIRNRHTIQRVINQKGFATPGLAGATSGHLIGAQKASYMAG
jgi:hypothetical protein